MSVRLFSRAINTRRSLPVLSTTSYEKNELSHFRENCLTSNVRFFNNSSIDSSSNVRLFNSTTVDASSMAVDDISNSPNEKFLLILGKPGGGKGTISKKILKDFPDTEHISTGDILRQHVRNETELGKEAKSYMDRGDLVPDKVMINLVLEDSLNVMESGKHILLDGFPRTIEQAVALDDNIDVEVVVDLNIPTETIVERISDRWIHPGSGRVYNYSYNPPLHHGKDDETGEDLVQRDDDKPETVRKRLDAYDKVTSPLVQYYDRKGVLKTFSGTMSDKIYPEVENWLKKMGLN